MKQRVLDYLGEKADGMEKGEYLDLMRGKQQLAFEVEDGEVQEVMLGPSEEECDRIGEEGGTYELTVVDLNKQTYLSNQGQETENTALAAEAHYDQEGSLVMIYGLVNLDDFDYHRKFVDGKIEDYQNATTGIPIKVEFADLGDRVEVMFGWRGAIVHNATFLKQSVTAEEKLEEILEEE
jgi:hypothetical protein